eukprot:CAMPEP_0115563594 /NCGR_PEP_ID=MMETSP0271-20121206/102117_1 /TAXON_ID=71861 /ORGANISM="Scrippsiella trochoidea, Strain CCMP3099" /LENGTH=144 /DNA_ID=CAMNT_0002997811 /DNA_START=118 /DNA_END=549 /DNA_ORIENTATION=-
MVANLHAAFDNPQQLPPLQDASQWLGKLSAWAETYSGFAPAFHACNARIQVYISGCLTAAEAVEDGEMLVRPLAHLQQLQGEPYLLQLSGFDPTRVADVYMTAQQCLHQTMHRVLESARTALGFAEINDAAPLSPVEAEKDGCE